MSSKSLSGSQVYREFILFITHQWGSNLRYLWQELQVEYWITYPYQPDEKTEVVKNALSNYKKYHIKDCTKNAPSSDLVLLPLLL